MPGTIDQVSELVARALKALDKINGDVRAAGQLLALLGWALPPGINDIGLSQLDVASLGDKLEALAELRSHENTSDTEVAAAVADVVLALKNALQDIQGIAASFRATPEYLSATHIVDEFFPRLADLLAIYLVGSAEPATVPLGVLLGIFEFKFMPEDPAIFQVEHVRQVVRWDRFAPLFKDPSGLMRDVYGWGTPQFEGSILIINIGRLVEHFADCVTIEQLPRDVEERIAGHAVPEANTEPAAQLLISLAKGLGFDAYDVGVALYPLRPTTAGGIDGGLGLSPYAFGMTASSVSLSDTVSLVQSASADLEGGVALTLRAGSQPQLLTGVLDQPDGGTSGSSSTASFALSLRKAAPPGKRLELFSAFCLHFDTAAITLGLGVDAHEGLNPALVANIEDGRILIVADQSDGFLASVLPKDGIAAAVNLNVSVTRIATDYALRAEQV
jgi:hypothetical protein